MFILQLQQGNPVAPTSTSPTTADTTAAGTTTATTTTTSPTAAAVSWVHSLTLTDINSAGGSTADTDAVIAAVHAQVNGLVHALELSSNSHIS
jgi:hypothetical protein